MMLKKRIPKGKRRELIVEAALEVFSKKGYDGSTIKKISERAQITQDRQTDGAGSPINRNSPVRQSHLPGHLSRTDISNSKSLMRDNHCTQLNRPWLIHLPVKS